MGCLPSINWWLGFCWPIHSMSTMCAFARSTKGRSCSCKKLAGAVPNCGRHSKSVGAKEPRKRAPRQQHPFVDSDRLLYGIFKWFQRDITDTLIWFSWNLWTNLEHHIYIYTYLHIHIYIYIFLYINTYNIYILYI